MGRHRKRASGPVCEVNDTKMRTLRQRRTNFALQPGSHNAITFTLILGVGFFCTSMSAAQTSGVAPKDVTPRGMTCEKTNDPVALASRLSPLLCGSMAPDENAAPSDNTHRESVGRIAIVKKPRLPRPDFNRSIFYKNKLEFSLDVGWLPINIPFPFNVFEGDPYDLYPIRYTLVPVLASFRWHLGDPWGPPVLRGNWDLTFSASATAIPRGPETHYFAYDMGLRRNFIPRNWKVTPYWDVRAGVGYINAKGPLGVYYAQGQNFTFNINMGAGARYNVNSRYGISAGLNWMHISNANLSSPGYSNYGINVYGPMVGLDVQLRPHVRGSD